MNMELKLIVLTFLTCSLAKAQNPLPYVMDMVHNNPGEKPFVTKYNNAEYLKSQGFNAMVGKWAVNCAVTFDSMGKLVPKGSDERKWIENHAKAIDTKLDSVHKVGLAAYPFTDFLVIPQSVWNKYKDEIRGEGKVASGGSGKRAVKLDIRKKRTQELLRTQVREIFERFPSLDGLTLRFGETYLQDAPYHVGGSPIRRGKEGINDHVIMLNILRDEICVKRNKKLFYRTWDFGYNFHDNPEFYLAVTNQVKPHPNLIFSIKYQQGDFHRNSPFNKTLGIGKHQQIVESQSAMEGYGKGAHPYYTGKGVIEGWPETKYVIDPNKHEIKDSLADSNAPRGLRDILKRGMLKGVVTWSRGGGWRGPYIKNEIWIDLNTFVVSQWALHPDKTEEELFKDFTDRLGLSPYNADIFRQIAMLSIEGVRKGQLNSFAPNDVWWARDDKLSISKLYPIIDYIVENNIEDKVLAEKHEAVAIWNQIESLSNQFACDNSELVEAVVTSCKYGRIKYSIIEQIWKLMIENAKIKKGIDKDSSVVARILGEYNRLFQEWRDLKKNSKSCATLYNPDKSLQDLIGAYQ